MGQTMERSDSNGACGPSGRESHRGTDAHDVDGWYTGAAERARCALTGRSYRQIGLDTNTHPETVRRYLRDGRPCARFLAAICQAYGLNPAWLLLGRPPVTDPGGTGPLRVVTVLELQGEQARVLGTACQRGEPASAGQNGRAHPDHPFEAGIRR